MRLISPPRVQIQKAFKGPHKLQDLIVDEVSLVTDPAILTSAESAAHSGFVVVKSDRHPAKIPEKVVKALSLRPGEDIASSVSRLAAACRTQLLAHTSEEDCYFMSALKVYDDKVVMGFWWEDDALDLSTKPDYVPYWACYYSAGEDGSYKVDRIAPIKVTISEVAETPQMTDAAEDPAGASVEMSAPEVDVAPAVEPPPPVEVVAAPGDEAAPAEVEAAEPAAPGNATSEQVGDPAPVVEASAEAPTSPSVDLTSVIRTLAEAGASFSVEFGASGAPVIHANVAKSSTVVVERPAAPSDDVSALVKELREQREVADQLRRRVAKSYGDDANDAAAPINESGGARHPLDPILAAANAQTRFN